MIFAVQARGLGPVMNVDAIGLREVLFEAACAHLFGAASIHDIDPLCAEPFTLHRNIDCGHATADNDHVAANGQGAHVFGLAQVGDIFNCIQNAGHIVVFHSEFVNRTKPDTEKNGIVFVAQFLNREVFPQRRVVAYFDAADRQDVFDLGLGEIVDGLVSSDAILVEAARLAVAIENNDIVPQHGQAMRAGQSGRSAADNCNFFARGLRTFK